MRTAQFEYINQNYGLKVCKGTIVEFLKPGSKDRMKGSVMSCNGHYIFIRGEDGKRYGPFHPTWEMEYL